MVSRNEIAIYSENHKISWKIQSDFMLKQVVLIVTRVRYRIKDFPVVVLMDF